jgi:phosphohistidine swiveling domain-containing protein
VLRNARARVRDRENLRFERTRLFGRVRLIMVELGRKFYALDLLDEPRDIFYLEVEECLGHVTGTGSGTDLRGLVTLRKAEFDRYRKLPAPAERFETRGPIHEGNTFKGKTTAAQTLPEGDRLKGLGCCPGVVRGRARVITDPRNATLNHGDILVAERTDPGWIMLFPSAAGLLVERGSLLSHSAIVSREMGIPSIVALTGVTQWLHDGDVVELDGSTGVVVRLEAAANSMTAKEAADGE